MSYPMTVPALLRAAADRIETYGLHKGWYVKGDPDLEVLSLDLDTEKMADLGNPPCCAIGAIFGSRGPGQSQYKLADEAVERLADALGLDYGPFSNSIPDWNDMKSRRKAQVVAALRKAADLAEQK